MSEDCQCGCAAPNGCVVNDLEREQEKLLAVLQWARDRVGAIESMDGVKGQFVQRMEAVGITYPASPTQDDGGSKPEDQDHE